MKTSTNKEPAGLLKAREAAEFLAISPRTLWSMTASREIPHVRIGRCVRYSIDDLKRFIGDRRTEERKT